MIKTEIDQVLPIKLPNGQRIGYAFQSIDEFQLSKGSTIQQVIEVMISEWKKEFKIFVITTINQGNGWYTFIFQGVTHLFPPFEKILKERRSNEFKEQGSKRKKEK